MLELLTKPLLKLGMIANLFEALHENEIMYCHWKSNEHLGASMEGKTDLDVLFSEDQKEKLELILRQLGFKRFNAIKEKQYKDIVDFIGLDLYSGKIIHLHTHYRLTMGEPYLKGYQFSFNIESHILGSRVFDKEFGIYCIQPAFELILLYLRESLKLRHRDIMLMHLKGRIHGNAFVLREYNWLKSRIAGGEIEAILKTIFPDEFAALSGFFTGEFTWKQLHRLSAVIKSGNKINRLYSPLDALLVRWFREATVILSRKLVLILNRPILCKRINPRGGIVVALIGADGSGKSTITADLKKTFEQKLDVYKIYFGRGDGNVSWARKMLMSIKLLSIRPNNNRQESHQHTHSIKKANAIRSLYKCLEALLVAREKRLHLKVMLAAKKKGVLVICDRFPQHQIMGYNDGPLLHAYLNSANPLYRRMAKMESEIYATAENHPPDILFKLVADAEVAERRKPGETSGDKLRIKINGIKQLKFKNTCTVIEVDATRPLNEVLCLIKKEIWNML